MAILLEPKACRACAKAKRKCDKQQPACRRCRTRGATCDYPPTRPGSFAVVLDDGEPLRQVNTPPSSATPSNSSASDAFSRDGGGGGGGGATGPLFHDSVSDSPRQFLTWFLSADSWNVGHREVTVSTDLCNSFLKVYVSTVQEWLGRWAATGGCPFIHPHLYAARTPDCLQIAFMTLTTYRNRTESNSEMLLKFVEDQASRLVGNCDGIAVEDPEATEVSSSVSLLDQVARLHALIVYETIGLFDSDIRLRHLAETRLPLLSRWAQLLLDSARRKFSSTHAVLDVTAALRLGPQDSQENLWYLWILSETIRRTWLMATGLNAIYSMLQRGWHPCPGGAMFTTRQGVWDAQTALAWEMRCTDGSGGGGSGGECFLQLFETDRLFVGDTTPDGVDEFTWLMMEVTYGLERMDKWKLESRKRRGLAGTAAGRACAASRA